MGRREQAAVIKAIHHVQVTLSGRPCPRITAKTVPVRDLPGFDEFNAMEAIQEVENYLTIYIPLRLNIFTEGINAGRDLSVGEVADRLAEMGTT